MRTLLSWMLVLVASAVSTCAATQVGSAPYKLSVTGAGNSYAPVFSADGKHVAFVSHANNLVANDDFGPHLDLFVRDLVASNTVLVSVSTNGSGGANDNIGLCTLSSNAQIVAFETLANNLAPGDTNRWRDIYVRDLASGVTRLITPGADGPSSNPLISEDGRRVIFESFASNLVTNDFNGTNDIFIHDLVTGVTELVTLNASNTASPDGPSHSPTISADGLTVAFVSHATNLVDGVTNTLGEVYVRNASERTTRWAMASHISSTRTNMVVNGFTVLSPYVATEPVLSGDGRFVLFKTPGQVLRFDVTVPVDTQYLVYTNYGPLPALIPPTSQPYWVSLFWFDNNPRLAGAPGGGRLSFTGDGRFAAFETKPANENLPKGIKLVDFETLLTNEFATTSCAGIPWRCAGPNNWYYVAINVQAVSQIVFTNQYQPSVNQYLWTSLPWLELDAAASRIIFAADATGLVDGITNRSFQIYQLDLFSRNVRLLSTNMSGRPFTDLDRTVVSVANSLSAIAFETANSELVDADLNRASDVFVRNVDTGETTLVSARHPDLPSVTGLARVTTAGRQSLSADGSKVAFLSLDSNLTATDTNRLTDAVLRDSRVRTTALLSGAFPVRLSASFVATTRPTNEITASILSADGDVAVFAGGTPFGTNIFRRDFRNDTNFLVSDRVIGVAPAVSADGMRVTYEVMDASIFLSNEYGLIDNSSYPDILVKGFGSRPVRQLGVSVSTNITPSGNGFYYSTGNGPSIRPVISPDGEWVVFQSRASNLTPEAGPLTEYQLFARPVDSGSTKRISHGPSLHGSFPVLPGGATNAVFSADGRFVFFDGATNRTIYRHDLLNDMNEPGTERRSNLIVCTSCGNSSPSSEGRLVAYESRPVAGGITNIFVKDIENGVVDLVSVSQAGTNGNGSSFSPLLSHDARFVVFASRASDLVPGDNNRATDIFVRDRWTRTTHCLSRNLAGTGTGNRVSSNPILSADGRTVAFQSFASDLVAGDYNDTRDVFVVTLGGPDNDGDGMEDDWEAAYFNTLARDGSGDFDNDGAIDRDEFRAGTNPTNDASILRVLRLSMGVAEGNTSTRTTVILWQSIPGRKYRVETKSDLGLSWVPVGSDIVATITNASISHSQDATGVTNQQSSFYRVVLVQ